MSQENVERYRQGIDAFNRRDLDAFLALADPGAVIVSRVLAIEGGTREGHDGTTRWWNDVLGVFPDFKIEIVWVREAGNLTVSELRQQVHGAGSAAPFDELAWQVTEWRDGLVVRWQNYATQHEALEAAGLSE
jgi:predicted SnoaL-like aldol condensation-catalyzing enzyme